MDFGKLLSVAQRNAASSEPKAEARYYPAKFAPPKKESKEKKLSANIQKFLAKKEQEEREKAEEARRKREELMAKRDPKAKRKIEKMLKVIKSANKSVLDDAIDTQDTAVTLQGPEQPDEDDYGYTSNVASALYQQLMDKYKATPEEKKFKDGEKRTMSKEDMARAKARVKEALNKVQEEENAPRSRKRKDATGGEGSTREETVGSGKKLVGPDRYDPEEERKKEAEAKAKEEAAKKKARRPQGPPPPDFATLLKLAEQKQLEPVKIETPLDALEKKKKEPERLMTKKEKKEYEERMAYLEEKKIRDRIRNDPKLSEKEKQIKLARYDAMKSGKAPPAPTAVAAAKPANVMAPNGRIPKLNSGTDKPAAAAATTTTSSVSKPTVKPATSTSRPDERRPAPSKPVDPSKSKLEAALTSKKPSSTPSKPSPASAAPSSSASKKPISTASGKAGAAAAPKATPPAGATANGQPKSRPFPPADVQRTRQFPPLDVQQRKRPPPQSSSQQSAFKKRRPVIEDSDSEYDSEMDDFIDDEDAEEDISSHIRAIFGYDKSRYRDEDFDDREMESNFAQVQREEYISKKIGLQEDLEDMRMEEEEKRRKALAKKKAAAAAAKSGGKRK